MGKELYEMNLYLPMCRTTRIPLTTDEKAYHGEYVPCAIRPRNTYPDARNYIMDIVNEKVNNFIKDGGWRITVNPDNKEGEVYIINDGNVIGFRYVLDDSEVTEEYTVAILCNYNS